MGSDGSATWMFDHKTVFVIARERVDEDTLMEVALEASADDVVADDEMWVLTGDNSVIEVDKERGPKLLWDAAGTVEDGGRFEANVRISDGNIAGLLMNVRDPAVGADTSDRSVSSPYRHGHCVAGLPQRTVTAE